MNRDPAGEGWFFKLELADPTRSTPCWTRPPTTRCGGGGMMDVVAELAALDESFVPRHVAPAEADIATMLHAVGAESLEALAAQTVPGDIRIAADARACRTRSARSP